MPQADDLAIWIDQFYQLVSERMDVEALYFEMNEFDINTDYWYIDCFAYSSDGGMNPDDMELVRAAQLSAKAEEKAWAGIPIYFTEHGYDFIVCAPGV